MRFLFTTRDGFPPYRVDVAVLFGKELAGRGHAIDWVLPSQEACDRERVAEWEGGRAFVGPSDRGHSTGSKIRNQLLLLRHDLKIFSLLRSQDYDFVQVKDKFFSFFPAWLACRMHRKKLFFWLSFPYAEEARLLADMARGPRRLLYLFKAAVLDTLFLKIVAQFSDHVFVQSDAMKAHFAARGVPEARMTPVPMGVAPQPDQDPDRNPDRGRPDSAFGPTVPGKVVYAGSLSRTRKPEFLIRVWREVAHSRPDLRLTIVGAGSDPADEQRLRALADDLGVRDAITFTGFLPIEQAWTHIREAEVCLSYQSADRVNNLGSVTKIIEYMSFGKPVVANEQPDQSRIVAESGGGLCVPAEETAFANAVLEILADPERARDMGARGRAYVENHRSYARIADRLEQTYFRLLGRNLDARDVAMGAAAP